MMADMVFGRASGAHASEGSAGSNSAPDLNTTLGDLLRRSARGDQHAFASFYDLTSTRVHGLAVRVVRDAAQAAEVTQDVYLEVWRQSARFDDQRGSVLPWLLTIAHRRAVDRVRSAQASVERD